MSNTLTWHHVRHATLADLPAMQQMYHHSRQLMRAHGNSTQWINGYPSDTLLRHDITQGVSYVIATGPDANAPLAGCFAFIIGDDPTYHRIEQGTWQEAAVPYGTIHRLACAPGHSGIARCCLDYCDRHAPSLRLDTHADNHIMQHIATRHGFAYCGIIYVADGSPRRAYQRLLPQQLLLPLQQYVETDILPRYNHYDEAHRQPHIQHVIQRSLAMAESYHSNRNMLYTAAAYHDLGLCEGRERHHLVSGYMLRHDKNLHQWFSPQQIELMAQAVEDHRASGTVPPRHLYGCILAEADRSLECYDVMARTLQYSRAHYPHYNKEQHRQRTFNHLHEKYGPRGYLQLLLPDSINREAQQELHALLADKKKLQLLFEKIWEQNY